MNSSLRQHLKRPLVLLEWEDHCDYGDTPWLQVDDIKENSRPTTMTSIGWIVHETKNFLVLSNSYVNEAPEVGSALVIIKSCITKREEVEWK